MRHPASAWQMRRQRAPAQGQHNGCSRPHSCALRRWRSPNAATEGGERTTKLSSPGPTPKPSDASPPSGRDDSPGGEPPMGLPWRAAEAKGEAGSWLSPLPARLPASAPSSSTDCRVLPPARSPPSVLPAGASEPGAARGRAWQGRDAGSAAGRACQQEDGQRPARHPIFEPPMAAHPIGDSSEKI